MRPCIRCGKPITRGKQCTCRNDRSRRGYGPDYQADRAAVLGQPCNWCGQPGTTADHVPPLRNYRTPAEWDGVLVPACEACQNARIPARDGP